MSREKNKKKLTSQQEFEIMKLVLDKFLWIGFGIMTYGVYLMFSESTPIGLVWMVSGIIILFLFTRIIVKEYEIIK
mgnify:CR=1 FL=1